MKNRIKVYKDKQYLSIKDIFFSLTNKDFSTLEIKNYMTKNFYKIFS